MLFLRVHAIVILFVKLDQKREVFARRGVAQLASAPALGAGGREFKSHRPDTMQKYTDRFPIKTQNFLHKELAKGRWFELTLFEQLGNIGSEVGRSINWRKKGDAKRSEGALFRALDLFDLTIADPRLKFRLKEILRAREVVCDHLAGDNEYSSTDESLEKYFMQFALAARKNR